MSFEIHPWKLAQRRMNPQQEKLLFAGNGHMGLHGTPEEDCRGMGVCIAGLPDAVCLHGIGVEVDGAPLDLTRAEQWLQELDMQTGMLVRSCTIPTAGGRVKVRTERFVSMAQKELLAVLYEITPDYDAQICLRPALNAWADRDVWSVLAEEESEDGMALLAGREGLAVGAAMSCWVDGLEAGEHRMERGFVQSCYAAAVAAHETVALEKYALCFTSREYDEKVLTTLALRAASRARELGYHELRDDHIAAWRARWDSCGVSIDGDDAALQSIRFSLYQLMSAWQGEDAPLPGRLNENALPVCLALQGREAAMGLLADGTLYPQPASAAYACFRFAASTGDYAWLRREALPVLHAVAQHFVERTRYNENRQKYGCGDDWYSNRMAAWCIGLFVTQAHRASKELLNHLGAAPEKLAYMMDAAQNMEGCGPEEAPCGEADDIIRGLYQLRHLYEPETLRRLYAPHASAAGASAWMQCILSAQLGDHAGAAESFRRSAGLCPEKAAETWLMLAEGLLGMQTMDGLSLSPFLPEGWQGYSLRLHYRGARLQVSVRSRQVCVELLEGAPFALTLCGDPVRLSDRVVHRL